LWLSTNDAHDKDCRQRSRTHNPKSDTKAQRNRGRRRSAQHRCIYEPLERDFFFHCTATTEKVLGVDSPHAPGRRWIQSKSTGSQDMAARATSQLSRAAIAAAPFKPALVNSSVMASHNVKAKKVQTATVSNVIQAGSIGARLGGVSNGNANSGSQFGRGHHYEGCCFQSAFRVTALTAPRQDVVSATRCREPGRCRARRSTRSVTL